MPLGSGTLLATRLVAGMTAIGCRHAFAHAQPPCRAFRAVTSLLSRLQGLALPCIATTLATERRRVLFDTGACRTVSHIVTAEPGLAITGTALWCHGLVTVGNSRLDQRRRQKQQPDQAGQAAHTNPFSPSCVQSRVLATGNPRRTMQPGQSFWYCSCAFCRLSRQKLR